MSVNLATIESKSNVLVHQKAQPVQDEVLQAELVKKHKQDLFFLFEEVFANQETKTTNGGNTISTLVDDYEISLVALELKPSFQADQTGLRVLISKRLKTEFTFKKDLLDISDYSALQENSQQYVYWSNDNKVKFEDLRAILKEALEA